MPQRLRLPRDTELCDARGEHIGTLGDAADILAASPGARDALLEQVVPEHVWATVGLILPARLVYLRHDTSGLHELRKLELEARVKVSVTPFAVHRGVLGETEVAWGTPLLEGVDTMVVASAGADGEPAISVDFRRHGNPGRSEVVTLRPPETLRPKPDEALAKRKPKRRRSSKPRGR